MNTYQFVWARDTHTFSCHHNTEPTTSTNRADSSSDSSSGPLKARQRCSLEEALAGRRERRRGDVSQQPSEWAGREERMEGGERGGEKKKPNKPTLPTRRHHSPRRGTAGARTGAARPLHEAGALSPRARSIFRPARPHAPPASADLEAQPAAGSGRDHAGPSVSAATRGRHAPATADVPRADSRVPPGARGSSYRPRPRAHPVGPPPAVAAHARPPLHRPDFPSRLGSGGRGYEPGTEEHPLLSASGGDRTPPSASFPQHRAAPGRLSSAQAGPLRASASPGRHPAPPPRPLLRFPPSDWPRDGDWAGPGELNPGGRGGGGRGRAPGQLCDVTGVRPALSFGMACPLVPRVRAPTWPRPIAGEGGPACANRLEMDSFGWVGLGFNLGGLQHLRTRRLGSRLLARGRASANAWRLCGALVVR